MYKYLINYLEIKQILRQCSFNELDRIKLFIANRLFIDFFY